MQLYRLVKVKDISTKNKNVKTGTIPNALTADQRLKNAFLITHSKKAKTKETLRVYTHSRIHTHSVVEGGVLRGRVACGSSSKCSSR